MPTGPLRSTSALAAPRLAAAAVAAALALVPLGASGATPVATLAPVPRPAWFLRDSSRVFALDFALFSNSIDPTVSGRRDSIARVLLERAQPDSLLHGLARLVVSQSPDDDSLAEAELAKGLPPAHPDRCAALYQRAIRLKMAGEEERARQLWQTRMREVRATFGSQGRAAAAAELGLAWLLPGEAHRERLECATRVLDMLGRLDSPDSLLGMQAFQIQADCHRALGDLPRARATAERCVALSEALQPRRGAGALVEHAERLRLLADICRDLGDAAGARREYDRVQGCYAREESLFTAEAGPVRGNYIYFSDDFTRLLIERGVSTPDAVDAIVDSLVDSDGMNARFRRVALRANACVLLHVQGHWAAAAELARRLLQRPELAIAPAFGTTVRTTLVAAELQLGHRDSAIAALRQQVATTQSFEDRIRQMQLLASLQARSGRPDDAIASALAEYRRLQLSAGRIASAGSDADAALFVPRVWAALAPAFSVVCRGEAGPGRVRDVWEAVATSRGRIADITSRRARSRAMRRRLEELRALAMQRLGVSRLAELRRQGPVALADTIEAWTRRRAEAERALALLDAREDDGPDSVRFEDAANLLPDRTVLVSFARVPPIELEPDSSLEVLPDVLPPLLEGDRYLAFVVERGATVPRAVPLARATDVDATVAAWRAAIRAAAESPADAPAGRLATALGDSLRRLVWDPLGLGADSLALLLTVADGDLEYLNLAALPAADGRYLAEHACAFHALLAERELLAVRERSEPDGVRVVAFGGIDYGGSGTAAPARHSAPGSGGGARLERSGVTAPCVEGLPARFSPLPGTRTELAELRSLLGPGTASSPASESSPGAGLATLQCVEGARATETAFKHDAGGAQVLHVATHGFFARACEGLGPRPILPFLGERSVPVSGLVFAGVNQPAPDAPDDGFLTAEEIEQLDLAGRPLVMLSACDTGLGEPQAGEGLVGLRRAFGVAGARAVVASLWKISDASTGAWMSSFYRASLGEGMSVPRAVQKAERALIEQRRRNGLSTSPYLWGGFVCSGDWR